MANLSFVKSLEIPVPPIDVQKKIASANLMIVDRLKENRQHANELESKLVETLFLQIFGDPFGNEKKFHMSRLGDLCEINPKKNEIANLKDETLVSFIEMAAVSNEGKIVSLATKTLSDVKKGFTYFREGDVLFAKITPCMENGKGAIALGLTNGIGFGSTEFHVLRPISGLSNSLWIFALTNLEKFRKYAASKMTGTAGQKRVPKLFLENVPVPIPPIDLQERFALFMSRNQLIQDSQRNATEKTIELFNSLMSKTFSEVS